MKSINLKLFSLLIAGIILLGYNRLLAQEGMEKHECQKGKGAMCQIPDLTEAQQKKIEELKLGHQKSMLQYRNQLAEKKAHLQTLRTADKADMNAINKTIDEIGALRTQMLKERENHHQQVRALLTDSQKIKFDQMAGKGFHDKCGMDKGCHKNCEMGKNMDKGPCQDHGPMN